MYAQIFTSSLTVGLGGSAGLESPIVTGAAFGSNYAINSVTRTEHF
jgi:CIC family chloride channel protein